MGRLAVPDGWISNIAGTRIFLLLLTIATTILPLAVAAHLLIIIGPVLIFHLLLAGVWILFLLLGAPDWILLLVVADQHLPPLIST